MKKSNIMAGLIIITIGILFLGNTYSWWNFDLFFKGWWTLFIIIPSVYGLFKKEWLSSALGIVIGVLLLCATRDYISWRNVGETFIPIVLILVGLSLIIKKGNHRIRKENASENYIGIFSSNEARIIGDFKGTSIVAIFGGVEIDLTEANIKEGAVIECVSIFGGVTIKLPKNVSIKTSGVPIFGGIENKATCEQEKYKLELDYVTIFGGIDLK